MLGLAIPLLVYYDAEQSKARDQVEENIKILQARWDDMTKGCIAVPLTTGGRGDVVAEVMVRQFYCKQANTINEQQLNEIKKSGELAKRSTGMTMPYHVIGTTVILGAALILLLLRGQSLRFGQAQLRTMMARPMKRSLSSRPAKGSYRAHHGEVLAGPVKPRSTDGLG